MAKIWHKVMGKDGFVVYRASASRTYASYNPMNGSFSSKMLLGNVPVEVLAKAPKSIKVKGKAWGVEVVRSYLEGEQPVDHIVAFRGQGPSVNYAKAREMGITDWSEIRAKCMNPADPKAVSFQSYITSRENSLAHVASMKERIAKGESECNDVIIVELS